MSFDTFRFDCVPLRFLGLFVPLRRWATRQGGQRIRPPWTRTLHDALVLETSTPRRPSRAAEQPIRAVFSTSFPFSKRKTRCSFGWRTALNNFNMSSICLHMFFLCEDWLQRNTDPTDWRTWWSEGWGLKKGQKKSGKSWWIWKMFFFDVFPNDFQMFPNVLGDPNPICRNCRIMSNTLTRLIWKYHRILDHCTKLEACPNRSFGPNRRSRGRFYLRSLRRIKLVMWKSWVIAV